MAKRPITPGQKAARARGRERFAAKLATNEAIADEVYARLQAGDPLRERDGTYTLPGGRAVDPAIVAILRHRKSIEPRGDLLVPTVPPAEPTNPP